MRWQLAFDVHSTGEKKKNADIFTLAARMEGLIRLSDRLNSVRRGRVVFIFPPNVSPHQCEEKATASVCILPPAV